MEDNTLIRSMKVATSQELINVLKELQSMAMKIYAQSHGYHWNIEGAEFPQYHKFFLKIYSDVYESIDGYAENLRKIKTKAPFGLEQLQQNSALRINDSLDLSAEQMLSELIKTNAQIIDKLKDGFDIATKEKEQGIANFLADRQDRHSFWQWQLTATLKK
jgi:starvation-inducible DNA-binding protein